VFKNILLATDGSDDAMHAAEAVAKIAEQFKSRVVLVTVYAPPILTAESANYAPTPALIADIQTSIIAQTASKFTKRGIDYETRMEIGNAAATILSVAELEHSDLIVLGSHGVGGIRRFLLGSVSDRVGHYARCAVLIVKREHDR